MGRQLPQRPSSLAGSSPRGRGGAVVRERRRIGLDPGAIGLAEPTDSHRSERFRGALRSFATGVTVVTSAGPDGPCGVTVNAFTPVSLSPPLVLVCLNAESSAGRAIERDGVFAVNILSGEQESLSRRFASPTRPRGQAAFHGVAHRSGSTGAPLLDGVACWLDCRVSEFHRAGDHVVVIGQVCDFASDPGREPLVFHAGRYRVAQDRDQGVPVVPVFHPLPTSPGGR
jgi:3-hydroxy-9,10-secoandrosta-1,3,5(10)-triene-9,17-dione monooxygenase reductase component